MFLSTCIILSLRRKGQGHSPKILYTYRAIQKDGLNFVRLYFLNYTWYVNDLHNI